MAHSQYGRPSGIVARNASRRSACCRWVGLSSDGGIRAAARRMRTVDDQRFLMDEVVRVPPAEMNRRERHRHILESTLDLKLELCQFVLGPRVVLADQRGQPE